MEGWLDLSIKSKSADAMPRGNLYPMFKGDPRCPLAALCAAPPAEGSLELVFADGGERASKILLISYPDHVILRWWTVSVQALRVLTKLHRVRCLLYRGEIFFLERTTARFTHDFSQQNKFELELYVSGLEIPLFVHYNSARWNNAALDDTTDPPTLVVPVHSMEEVVTKIARFGDLDPQPTPLFEQHLNDDYDKVITKINRGGNIWLICRQTSKWVIEIFQPDFTPLPGGRFAVLRQSACRPLPSGSGRFGKFADKVQSVMEGDVADAAVRSKRLVQNLGL